MTSDLYMDGRAKVASYRAMLESLLETGLPAMTHRDVWAGQPGTDRYLCIRHDVDHSLEMAVHMARIENSLGVRASYYLLPPGDYDKLENYYGRIEGSRIVQTEALREAVREIADLGHEVGLHNDFLQLSRRTARTPQDLILEQLAFFRGAGVEVVGSASHGSRFARRHSYVNYEIFSECLRPNSQRRTVALEDGSSFELFSISMAALGLAYEAYSVPRQVYISDTGSRLFVGSEYYDSMATTMMADLVGASTKVVALFHPEWWKVTDQANPPAFASAPATVVIAAAAKPAAAQAVSGGAGSGMSFARPDGKPFRVAIRGDCCCRRAVVMNKNLFPAGVELIINEKCPNACFVETMQGKGAEGGRGVQLCDADAMTGSLKHYFLGQFDRSVLTATDLDLLMIDSYSDMNFERWRHRKEGWSAWVHPKFIRDPGTFEKEFEKLGYASLDEATEAICAVVDRVRENNPGLPVMFLNQPVEYYPKLHKRMDFYALGERVAQRRANVYAAKPLAKDELVPADVGSCGPGLTLHFDAGTYKRMMLDAWNQGLRRHFSGADAPLPVPTVRPPEGAKSKAPAEAVALASAPAPAPAPATTPAPAAVRQMSEEKASTFTTILNTLRGRAPTPAPQAGSDVIPVVLDVPVAQDLPVVHIGYGEESDTCISGCSAQVDAAFKTYAQYFRHPEIDANAPLPRFTPMLIPTPDIQDFGAWESHIKTFGNGARLRQKRKALGLGYYAKMFAWKQFIPDVHDINHSKASRSGGAMRGSYLRTIEEMGGAPDRHHEVVLPKCQRHWSLQFGTFMAEPGYKQGSIEVNERLLAYISLRRCGDVALYSQIMGHGDYLNQGVLVLLHHEVIRWISENAEGLASGLRYVMYGGQQNGGESLLQFKRQAGFTAHHVFAYRGEVPAQLSAGHELEVVARA